MESGLRVFKVTIQGVEILVEASSTLEARSLAVESLREELKTRVGLELRVGKLLHTAGIIKCRKIIDYRGLLKSPPFKLPAEDQGWLTGFWEGDGTAYYTERLAISLTQREPEVLIYIRNLLQTNKRLSRDKGGRGCYGLDLSNQILAYPVLEVLCSNVVSLARYNQLLLITSEDPISRKLEITPKISCPTIPWIVGFWDAEGSEDWTGSSINLSFSQKSPEVLSRIGEVVGGKVSSYKSSGFTKSYHSYLVLGVDNSKKLIPLILKYSHTSKKSKLWSKLLGLASKSEPWNTYLLQNFVGVTPC